MRTDMQFSEEEIEKLNSALDDISCEVSRITGTRLTRKDNLIRRFYFGKDQIFRDVRFGYTVTREGVLEFGIVAKLSKPCDKPSCFMERLKDIFEEDDNLEFHMPDLVRVTYKCCLNIDDCEFERILDCIKERILLRFTKTHEFVQNEMKA